MKVAHASGVRAWLSVGCAAIIGCACSESLEPQAQVQFVLDAPFCSSAFPVQFFIDRVIAGTDTFRVNFAPNRTVSRAFPVPAGAHILGARTTGTLVFMWPDTLVSLAPSAAFTDTLPFYCS